MRLQKRDPTLFASMERALRACIRACLSNSAFFILLTPHMQDLQTTSLSTELHCGTAKVSETSIPLVLSACCLCHTLYISSISSSRFSLLLTHTINISTIALTIQTPKIPISRHGPISISSLPASPAIQPTIQHVRRAIPPPPALLHLPQHRHHGPTHPG